MRILGALWVAGAIALGGFFLVDSIGRTLLPGATHELGQSLLVLFFSFVAFWLIVTPVYEKLAGRPGRPFAHGAYFASGQTSACLGDFGGGAARPMMLG